MHINYDIQKIDGFNTSTHYFELKPNMTYKLVESLPDRHPVYKLLSQLQPLI